LATEYFTSSKFLKIVGDRREKRVFDNPDFPPIPKYSRWLETRSKREAFTSIL
jgi:hypothetical protein